MNQFSSQMFPTISRRMQVVDRILHNMRMLGYGVEGMREDINEISTQTIAEPDEAAQTIADRILAGDTRAVAVEYARTVWTARTHRQAMQ